MITYCPSTGTGIETLHKIEKAQVATKGTITEGDEICHNDAMPCPPSAYEDLKLNIIMTVCMLLCTLFNKSCDYHNYKQMR